MQGNFGFAAVARVRSRALGSTALTVLALVATQAAWAQTVTPPPTGSLPGSFSTNVGTVTYTANAAGTTGTITTTPGIGNILQWGGSALGTKVTAPSGVAATNNFIIGSGATLNINQSAAGAIAVLVTDQTGNPSQIYGALNASGLSGGPLYVSNTNGVIVGPTGVLSAPTTGIGLLGYAVDQTSFPVTGLVTVSQATAGTGGVTVMNGATIGNGPLLVASTGTVNIGALSSAPSPNYVIAGFGFSTTGLKVVPTVAAALPTGASSVINFTASATLTVDQLFSGGAVNNAANLTLPAGALVTKGVQGLFTNNGKLTETNDFNNNQAAGGLLNQGTINETLAGLQIQSDKNVNSNGVLNMTGGPGAGLNIEAANINIGGKIQIGGKDSSATNALASLNLMTLGSGGTVATPGVPQTAGVVDVAASIFTNGTGGGTILQGNAIRVISGGVFASAGNILLGPGTNAAAVADPFYDNAGNYAPGKGASSLNYTLSLFPGTLVQDTAANSVIAVTNPAGGTNFSNSSGLNLNGQLSAPNILITANNINSNNGLNGGFVVPDGGTIGLTFFGNVNNPNGAAANGSTSFLYNYVPVSVGMNGTKAGTALITLAGPSFQSTKEQNVNLLVQGNVNLADGSAALTPPGPFPTAPVSPYANNHLVVTATGNIGFDPNVTAPFAKTFYWPGLVWLTPGATASNPTAAPNSTASINLGDNSGTFAALYPAGTVPTNVNFSNLIPADLTKPSIGGQVGGGGVHFQTNNLNLAPSTGGTSTVTISNNSWAVFLNHTIAQAFATAQGNQFFGGVIQTNGQVNVQKLPAANFQP